MSEPVSICEHIHDHNVRCGSPAIKGFHFCYYHARHHLAPRVNGKRKIRLSALESAQSLQIALTQISQAILDGELETARAFALVQLLQLTAHAIEMNQFVNARNAVELPASMAYLVQQPQPEANPGSGPEPASSNDESLPDSVVRWKKLPMSTEEFNSWRRIMVEGESHPQFQEATRKVTEYLDALTARRKAMSA